MKRYLRRFATIIPVILIAALLLPVAFGQETTAGLQGTVKDPTGALVPKAKVEVTSPALIGAKKLDTDAGGYFRFANLPPGVYTLVITAPNFRTYKREKIELTVGRLPTIDITLEIGTTSEVVEVTGAAPLVDVSQSKVATTISEEVLKDIPKGGSYQSLIQLAPGARVEPLQAPTGGNAITGGFSNHQGTNQGNGFQIDGASNTESSYLVEGMETASAFDGTSSANVPMEFIQEVQVKTSGFEAEHGGALGGVVNVIQKRGSNAWHGSIFSYYTGDAFNAAPNRTLRNNPNSVADSTTRTPSAPEFFQATKDHYRIAEPGFELGGPIVKDRLWLFVSSVPRFANLARTVNFQAPSTPGARTYHENINTYYSLGRVDFLATQKIRVFGSWQYGYERGTGTNLPGADSPYGQVNTSAKTAVDNFNGGIGYVAPNVIYGTGADITLTPNLVATTRFGYFYQDYQDRGLPTGIRDIYRDTNYPYTAGNANKATAAFKSLSGASLPSSLINSAGFANIGVNQQTVFDKFWRSSLNQDLAYFKKWHGTHNLKFGYSYSRNRNDALTGAFNTADVYVGYGLLYTPQLASGTANCKAIMAQNLATYGVTGGAIDPKTGACSVQGNFGTVNFRDLSTSGKVNGTNHALYVQDAWTIGRGFTINAGLRTEKEAIPSYTPDLKGVSFDWTQKMAPRLGAAWDVFQNGKMKVFGSFGYFYQVMNLQLARGSWGGDYWHDCVYALDIADYTSFNPTRNSAGNYCPAGGGTVPANGTFPGGSLRFIENVNFRIPSNDPNTPGTLGASGLVDPNLQPMKQHETVFGSDFELKKNLGLEVRYSRKRLDRTIEDAGLFTPDGEQFYIVNPGQGINKVVPSSQCNGCVVNPPAIRNYDGLETRVTYRGTGKWFGSASYTYSRYYGNYSGLTSTDQSDSNLTGARNGANSDRAFDEPFMSFDSHGKAIDGPLSTDRPHTFKAYGYYRLKYHSFETMLGGVQQWYSGTPLSSYLSVQGAPVFVEGRGNWADITRNSNGDWVLNGVESKRTPAFSQTDFNFVQQMHVSKNNERLVASFEATITNLFNQHAPVDYNSNLIGGGGASQIKPFPCGSAGANCVAGQDAPFDYAAIMKGFNYLSSANGAGAIINGQYGLPYLWQSGRSMRFKVKFTF
jgi:outer membrane receptor protein involved in Fe transport